MNNVLKTDDKGLIPAIAQDMDSGEILMLGYMNAGSLKRTIEGTQVWFYSRSRDDLWHKGEVSGNYLNVKEIWTDCDSDTLLLKVKPEGPVCHTGAVSCFFNKIVDVPNSYEQAKPSSGILEELFGLIQDRKKSLPVNSYTTELFNSGIDRIAQKVIEEAGETALASLRDNKDNVVEETCDLIYHLLVLLSESGIGLNQIWEKMSERNS
ncbi:MAG TPA: bifunctional phosphoribosyl-AMP cyclohydrolase/phosphoribosyl-ATP pyrophosphatase [Dehalococcoidia bacterium]|jgi:phosphoribosyl-ATP pyrophosphohydrolase/phosphoribosyl-AMP cyclohydrolase|nr:bifunctional phosphoribosyl-AMP cyclohydrolase/phosphoribosyl-ATP pyrophosphatase [Dehalococcoidia bacterium]|tara:strand:+ start:445 stop:1071 length:627 start_codon:yes stop_codon:yes gene_type:complete